jgi:hypothetical protein
MYDFPDVTCFISSVVALSVGVEATAMLWFKLHCNDIYG